jgi:hypothetical protein
MFMRRVLGTAPGGGASDYLEVLFLRFCLNHKGTKGTKNSRNSNDPISSLLPLEWNAALNHKHASV